MKLRVVMWCVLLLALGRGVAAQQRSPAQEVLGQARTALLDLRYDVADSLTRGVLEIESRLRRTDRILALQIAAAAQFPEEPEAQHRDSATAYLQRLIRLAPNAQIPPDISWSGLDSLTEYVRNTTFGVAASPSRDNRMSVAEPAYIGVAASQPAQYRLILHPVNGDPDVHLADAGPSLRANLPIQLVDSSGVKVPAGEYELIVLAFDGGSLDSISLRYRARLDATPLRLETVPTGIDSSRLLPERTHPARMRSIVAGILIGTGTALAATVARDPATKSTADADNRALGTGVVLGLASIAAGFLLDRGDPIRRNIEQNRLLRENMARQIEDLTSENLKRRGSYSANLVIDVEALP